MDTGRLPTYRSSYLLRFHPYPRGKPSARERVEAPTWEDEFDGPHQTNTLQLEGDSILTLNEVIQTDNVHNKAQLRHRRLSMTSLVIDLAVLLTKKLSLKHD